MSLHYNAFISYKHAELDNKVAAAIEWDLEHYHIPKKIQKKTGYKKIERIFRDKDELPITSDLSNTIEEALFNSDFLIVLCSTNTHLSTWVEREIKLFLQNHPQENVLTVLVDGEPHDVIPEILQNREVQRYNDHGQLETVLEPVEPLSCDYRLPRREAKNVELPRLAATLIGCSYNELMNRQRQYKMKRLTAVFSGAMALAVGFGAYMLYSNARINENYRQSLISQSKYLSNASMQMLDDEKRIDALHLALAALPSEENPKRPVIPEAVSAITKATLAYTTESGSNITATWNYTMPDIVTDYYIDRNGCSFAARDQSKNIRVWNRETHELLYEYSSVENEAKYYAYIAPDKLMICGEKYIQVVDVVSGTIKWEINELKENDIESAMITEKPVTMNDGSILIGTYSSGLYRLSPEDGSVIDIYKVKPADTFYESASFKSFKLSPDEKTILFSGNDDQNRTNILFFYDIETGKNEYYDLAENGITADDIILDKFIYLDNDRIMILVDKEEGYGSYGFFNMDILTTNYASVYCLDANDLSLKWKNDFKYNAIPYGSDFYDLKDINAVCFYEGNIIDIWDKDTGELISEYNVNESIVGATKGDDTYPSFVTVSGKMGNPFVVNGVDSMTMMATMTDDIDKISFGKGAYVNTYRSSNIIFYQSGVHDENYKEFNNSGVYKSILTGNYLFSDDILVILGASPDGSKTKVGFYDANSKECFGEKEIGGDDTYQYELAGFEDGIARVTYCKDRVLKLLEIDAHTLEVKETVVDEDYSGAFVNPIYSEGKLIYYRNLSYEHLGVVVKDLTSDDEDFYETGKTVYQWEYDEKLKYLYISCKEADYVIRIDQKDHYEVFHSANWSETAKIHIDAENERILVTDDQFIQLLDLEGNEITKLVCPDLGVFGMTLYTPDQNKEYTEILVVYADGFLYRYNAESGEYIGKIELSYNKAYTDASFVFDMDNKKLYVQMGPILNIMDLDSWTMTAYLTSALAYHKGTDTFLVYSYSGGDDPKIGYFKQYTVDELIQKGREMLKGQEIREELRTAYGIG